MTAITIRPPTRALTVLLVDDDPDCRMLLRDAIEQEAPRHRVHEADNGRDALDILYRTGRHADVPRPDLICLDMEMPGMTGLEVLQQIKTDPSLCSIPVVMLTGCDSEVVKRLAAQHGVNSYTLKPADGRAFVDVARAVTNYWLRLHQFPCPDGEASRMETHNEPA